MDKIKTKIVSQDKSKFDSRLELNISGKLINHVIINAIRRTILTKIPVYAFNNISITKNTSVFNNNYIKLRLRNLPVFDIKNNKQIYVKKEVKEEDLFDETLGVLEGELDLSIAEDFIDENLDNQMTMYVKYKNETTDIFTCTTEHAEFYLNDEKIKNPYTNHIEIISLQPNQEIDLTAKTELNIEENGAIYSPVSICCYKENKENDYTLILESRGQIPENVIIERALLNLKNILNTFYNSLPDETNKDGKLVIEDGDHTLGTLLTDYLNGHKDVIQCSYNIIHPLGKKMNLHYKLNKNLDLVIKDAKEYYYKLFDSLIKNVIKIK